MPDWHLSAVRAEPTLVLVTYHETFRFEAPLPSTQADVQQRWARTKYRDQWHLRVKLTVGSRRPPEPLTRATVTLTRASSRPSRLCDADNIRISFKPILDGLVACGVLAEDNIGTIGEPLLQFEDAPPKRGWCSVEVEEVHGDG